MQMRGLIDSIIGPAKADSIREAIGYESPMWQAPDTGILAILQNAMTNPRAQVPGVGPAGQIGYAADAAKTRYAAGALAAQESQTKLLTAQAAMRTAQTPKQLKEANIKVGKEYGTAARTLEVIQQFKNVLRDNDVAGMGPAITDFFKKNVRGLGIDLGETDKEIVINLVAHLQDAYTELYGENVNKQEMKRIDDFLVNFNKFGHQAFGTDKGMLEFLRHLEQRIGQRRQTLRTTLEAQGLGPYADSLDLQQNYSDHQLISSRTDNQ